MIRIGLSLGRISGDSLHVTNASKFLIGHPGCRSSLEGSRKQKPQLSFSSFDKDWYPLIDKGIQTTLALVLLLLVLALRKMLITIKNGGHEYGGVRKLLLLLLLWESVFLIRMSNTACENSSLLTNNVTSSPSRAEGNELLLAHRGLIEDVEGDA